MKKLQGPEVVRMLGCAVARPFVYILTKYMKNGSMYDMYRHTPAFQGSNTSPFVKRFKMGLNVCRGTFKHQLPLALKHQAATRTQAPS